MADCGWTAPGCRCPLRDGHRLLGEAVALTGGQRPFDGHLPAPLKPGDGRPPDRPVRYPDPAVMTAIAAEWRDD